MAKLTCLNSVQQWKSRYLSEYPELDIFVQELEKLIKNTPDSGKKDYILSKDGKVLPTKRQAVNLFLFSERYAIGYNRLNALYLYNNDTIVIVKMYFS
jgi:hypothetical protein